MRHRLVIVFKPRWEILREGPLAVSVQSAPCICSLFCGPHLTYRIVEQGAVCSLPPPSLPLSPSSTPTSFSSFLLLHLFLFLFHFLPSSSSSPQVEAWWGLSPNSFRELLAVSYLLTSERISVFFNNSVHQCVDSFSSIHFVNSILYQAF